MNSIDQMIRDLLNAIEQENRREDRILSEILNALRQNAAARAAFNRKFSALVERTGSSPLAPTANTTLQKAEQRVHEEFEALRRSQH